MRYKHDIKKYKDRIVLGTETFCNDARLFYDLAQKYPRIIGDFVWAGMDYLGEVAVGSTVSEEDCDNLVGDKGWMSAGSGRVDLIGNQLGEVLYTKVAFELEKIQIATIAPRILKLKHSVSSWKFSKAIPSWSYEGDEGKTSIIEVYSRGYKIKLFLNGKLLKTQKVNKYSQNEFKIKYEPGELKAVSYNKDGTVFGEATLVTANKETKLNLTAENGKINTSELLYLHLDFTDNEGTLKPMYNDNIKIKVENGEILAYASGNPFNDKGFHVDETKTYYGRALAIIKPIGVGTIKVAATSKDYNNSIEIPVTKA